MNGTHEILAIDLSRPYARRHSELLRGLCGDAWRDLLEFELSEEEGRSLDGEILAALRGLATQEDLAVLRRHGATRTVTRCRISCTDVDGRDLSMHRVLSEPVEVPRGAARSTLRDTALATCDPNAAENRGGAAVVGSRTARAVRQLLLERSAAHRGFSDENDVVTAANRGLLGRVTWRRLLSRMPVTAGLVESILESDSARAIAA